MEENGEEEWAAIIRIQAAARGWLGRIRALEELQEVYERVPDLRTGAYFYYNRRTNESSWNKPRLVKALLGAGGELGPLAAPYTEEQAAILVQAAWRRKQARELVRLHLAREWSKVFDEGSGTWYYYNSRTGVAAWEKPALFGTRDIEDFAELLALEDKKKKGSRSDVEYHEDYDEEGNWVVWERDPLKKYDGWVVRGWYEREGGAWVDAPPDPEKIVDSQYGPNKLRRRKSNTAAARRYPRSRAQEIIDRAEDAEEGSEEGSVLNLVGLGAQRISSRVYSLAHLRELYLRDNRLTRLSPDLAALENLTVFDCSSNMLREIPDSIQCLQELRALRLANNAISSKGIPGSLYTLSKLEILNLSGNKLDNLPVEVGNVQLLKLTREWEVGIGLMRALRVLDLSHNALSEYPAQLEMCLNLEELYLGSNYLTAVPPSIQQNGALKVLMLERNELVDLPVALNMLSGLRIFDFSENRIAIAELLRPPLGRIANLETLDAHGNKLERVPEAIEGMASLLHLDLGGSLVGSDMNIGSLRRLKTLKLSGCGLEMDAVTEASSPTSTPLSLPSSTGSLGRGLPGFSSLTKLEEVVLSHNSLARLPLRFLSSLGKVRLLDLSFNGLCALGPDSGIGALLQVETLSLQHNALHMLPDELCRLNRLVHLDVRGNRLSALPQELGKLSLLKTLDAGLNEIAFLPKTMHLLVDLEELRLDGNRLTHLATEMSSLTSIRVLDLSKNQFSAPPSVVRSWPSLQHFIFTNNPIVNRSHQDWKCLLVAAEKGVSALLAEDYDAAVTHLTQAASKYDGLMESKSQTHSDLRIRREDLDYSYHYHLAVAHILRAKSSMASGATDLVRSSPDCDSSGMSYSLSKPESEEDFQLAIVALERAEEIRILSRSLNLPGDVYLARGKANASLGRHDKAIVDFNKAARALPGMLTLREMRVLSRHGLGQYDQAEIESHHLAELLQGQLKITGLLIEETMEKLARAQIMNSKMKESVNMQESITSGSKRDDKNDDDDSDDPIHHGDAADDDVHAENVPPSINDETTSVTTTPATTTNADDGLKNEHPVSMAPQESSPVDEEMKENALLLGSDEVNHYLDKESLNNSDKELEQEQIGDFQGITQEDSEAVARESTLKKLEAEVLRLESVRDNFATRIIRMNELEKRASEHQQELIKCIDFPDMERGYEIGPTGVPIKRRVLRRALLTTGESEARYAWDGITVSMKQEQLAIRRREERSESLLRLARGAATKASNLIDNSNKALDDCKVGFAV